MTVGSSASRGLSSLVVLGAFLAVSHAEPARTEPLPAKDTVHRFETVAAGERVRVVNRFGNVYARFGGYDHRLELLATVQRLDADLPPLEMRTEPSDSGLAVTIAPEGAGAAPGAGETRRDRVDLVLFVPLGAAVDVETDDDSIEIKGLKSDVSASSVKGDITIRGVQGRVHAKSSRGHLTAALNTGATAERQELTTETGEIEVYLWEDADMNVELDTSGEISTDFSLQIEHHRLEEPGKHAVAVVGHGGPQLLLRSNRGRIRLLRLQGTFTPEVD